MARRDDRGVGNMKNREMFGRFKYTNRRLLPSVTLDASCEEFGSSFQPSPIGDPEPRRRCHFGAEPLSWILFQLHFDNM